jgi:Spy/CpxP family protein refolding chaperone
MSKRTIFGLLILLAALASPALAQPAPGGPGGPPDFAQMRQMMMERMKEALGASDDEWKVLQPKIEKVQQLQRDASGGRGMGMLFRPPGGGQGGPGGPGAGPGGPGGFFGNQNPSPVQEKANDLRTTLDNKDAKPEEVKAKLQALRDARAKAKEELGKSQEDLRGLLTQRQEAVLVMMGMLE